ncbi:hypothetical protein DFH05DRAFT_1478188 [Lentinula detonsa]|uniref:Secreted protein n=1 Tax=Lentinula detonsa TaxID=2804962 RepID=A0A9W8U042_9AGAR|nr:hypothetical protein DFH05DRAFT_1478188 [Lentinula detonsa]
MNLPVHLSFSNFLLGVTIAFASCSYSGSLDLVANFCNFSTTKKHSDLHSIFYLRSFSAFVGHSRRIVTLI